MQSVHGLSDGLLSPGAVLVPEKVAVALAGLID